MTSTISLMNVKGGVGKTTVCFNLAHALKLVAGKRVLLVDLDLQENLTDRAVANPKEVTTTVYDMLVDSEVLPQDCIYETVIRDVDIIPSEIEVVRLKREIDPSSNPDVFFRLSENLQTLHHVYDYILIDTHPDIDILVTLALMASTHYIIPVKPESDSIKGLKITDEYAAKLVKANRRLQELGILITDLDRRTAIASSFYDSLSRMFGDRVLKTVIGTNVAITNAAAERKTIFQYDLRQSGCRSFRALAREVIFKCEGLEVTEDGEEAAAQ